MKTSVEKATYTLYFYIMVTGGPKSSSSVNVLILRVDIVLCSTNRGEVSEYDKNNLCLILKQVREWLEAY